jgi:hypothetical protein
MDQSGRRDHTEAPDMRGPTYKTWRWRGGLVYWSYTIPARSGESAVQCLERAVLWALDILRPFARARAIAVSTREQGDDAHKLQGPEVSLPALHAALGPLGAPHKVIMTLDLAVMLDDTNVETWLDKAARLYVEMDEQSETDHSVTMWLSLDVDIYSPTTWGESRDNAELARLNGPRLSQFLDAIREQLGGKLDDIDVGDYDGHVDENGFH